jgi:serine-type D-Ala-D-Ala carboxypeptidase/endopeptidase (penicillin-binding protein 4)
MRFFSFSLIVLTVFICSCGTSARIASSARTLLLNDSSLKNAHIGIAVLETGSSRMIYNFQGNKYFVPASNTKIPTCYAAMKYLGDSLPGIRYAEIEDQNLLLIQPTGDPTFLHPDFPEQPVLRLLTGRAGRGNRIALLDTSFRDQPWGSGWTWNDYDASYVVERSSFPIYGNVIRIKTNDFNTTGPVPSFPVLQTGTVYFDSLLNSHAKEFANTLSNQRFRLARSMERNEFVLEPAASKFMAQVLPFVTHGNETALKLLGEKLGQVPQIINKSGVQHGAIGSLAVNTSTTWTTLYSRPTDSMLRVMMHRSDNFFAEQSLLMVSLQQLGIMNDNAITSRLLQTDFSDLPQKPRWVDGSGLSRYNLFTPEDFVKILDKIRTEFGMQKVRTVFATGNSGTLANLYKEEEGYIYAKTGTLSGVVALSGYLYTKKNRLLVFSVLVNNHQGSATAVRKAVEKWIRNLRNSY